MGLAANSHSILTGQQLWELSEIRRLITEATLHAWERDPYGKSGEGNISVNLDNPLEWDEEYRPPRPPTVTVYSYVLGPHRAHYFDSPAQALEIVKQWHAAEMARPTDLDEDWDDLPGEDPYLLLEEERTKRFMEFCEEMDKDLGE